MLDFVIIGGGTAGLSAAVYACRANKKTLVIERESFGGQIVDAPTVENYPGIGSISGAQFASDLFDQAEKFGATFKCETVTGIERTGDALRVVTDIGSYETKRVIIAAGCEHRRLGLNAEAELIGSGVSYCALCDGAFFADKTVAVVGGGNAAFTDALYLSDIAKLVYIIHRRDTYRAEPTLVERAEGLNTVRLVKNAVVKELLGSDELTGIKITENGAERTLELDGLFVAIGQQPDNTAFGVELDADGYIVTDELCRTSVAGVYAAGDCRRKAVRQLTTAAADGAIAVQTALKD
ncbi:MAG: FAD-dependent oxidoreductase [Roseburia sp.]|nr:FAD-dependent oxidoreductase [Roseburia sp.]